MDGERVMGMVMKEKRTGRKMKGLTCESLVTERKVKGKEQEEDFLAEKRNSLDCPHSPLEGLLLPVTPSTVPLIPSVTVN